MHEAHSTAGSRPIQIPPGGGPAGPGADSDLLGQAAEQARLGRYQMALDLLARAAPPGTAPCAHALDLRAKVYAQLGHGLEAERCWELARQADPDNPHYPLALARLRSNGRLRPGRRFLEVSLIVLLTALILVGQDLYRTSGDADIEQRRERQDQAVAQDLVELRHAVADLSGTLAAFAAGAPKATAINARLDALGARDEQIAAAEATQVAAMGQAIREIRDEQQAHRQMLKRIGQRLATIQKMWSRAHASTVSRGAGPRR